MYKYLKIILANIFLIKTLVSREIGQAYKGSFLGIIWSFIYPIFMILIYSFIFIYVFKAKWGETGTSNTEFALMLYSGLIVYNFFTECLNSSPTLITDNPNYVKKILFPLEILPLVRTIRCFVIFLINFFVLLVFSICFYHLSLDILTLIGLFFFLFIFVLSLSYFASAIAVYFKDITQIIIICTSVLLFLSPVFYPLSAIPEKLRIFIDINPLSHFMEIFRYALYGTQYQPNMLTLIAFISSLFLMFYGVIFFNKVKRGFADVI